MDSCAVETLYRFLRTASEYIQGRRNNTPYPSTFSSLSAVCAIKMQAVDRGAATVEHCTDASLACDMDADSSAFVQDAVQGTGSFPSMQTVYAAVACCTACPLAATRSNTVAGEGPEELSHLSNSVDVLVIGEGPGADEDVQGRPFVGRAGQLLDKMLEAIQLSRKTNCYITNVVKCRPPQNRNPAFEECEACRCFLDAQIRLTHPKMILVMGRVAVQQLLDTSEGIGRLRGQFFNYHGVPLMATYHPSALLRNEALKRPAWEDLKKFREELARIRQKG